jgi:hypothetical protein
MKIQWFLSIILSLSLGSIAQTPHIPQKIHHDTIQDSVLRTLVSEVQRQCALLQNTEGLRPHHCSARILQVERWEALASQGKIERIRKDTNLTVVTQIYVGDSSFNQGRFASNVSAKVTVPVNIPPNLNTSVLKLALWGMFDADFREASSVYAAKKDWLRNHRPPLTPDWTQGPVIQAIKPLQNQALIDSSASEIIPLLQNWSQILDQKDILEGRTSFRKYRTTLWFASSEGTVLRQQEVEHTWLAAWMTQAIDGEVLWDYARATNSQSAQIDTSKLWPETRIRVQEIQKLRHSPATISYRGPVLFEGDAATIWWESTLGQWLNLMTRDARMNAEDPGSLVRFWKKRVLAPGWDVSLTKHPRDPGLDHQGTSTVYGKFIESGILKNLPCSRSPWPRQKMEACQLPGHVFWDLIFPRNLTIQGPQMSQKAFVKSVAEMAQQDALDQIPIILRFADPEAADLLHHEKFRASLEEDLGNGELNLPKPIAMYQWDVKKSLKTERVRGIQFSALSTMQLRTLSSANFGQQAQDYRAMRNYIGPQILVHPLLDLRPLGTPPPFALLP